MSSSSKWYNLAVDITGTIPFMVSNLQINCHGYLVPTNQVAETTVAHCFLSVAHFTSSNTPLPGPRQLVLASAKILSSENGWILFFKEPSSIFFYSPFNNKVIKLPPLEIGFKDKAIFLARGKRGLPSVDYCLQKSSETPSCFKIDQYLQIIITMLALCIVLLFYIQFFILAIKSKYFEIFFKQNDLYILND